MTQIREDQEYGGQRVQLTATLGNARINLQVDIGFGDVITPAADELEYPSLLGLPSPRLRAYPRETVIAEKLEAMVVLGMANSRMKDFYDVWMMSRELEFNGRTLARAIQACSSSWVATRARSRTLLHGSSFVRSARSRAGSLTSARWTRASSWSCRAESPSRSRA